MEAAFFFFVLVRSTVQYSTGWLYAEAMDIRECGRLLATSKTLEPSDFEVGRVDSAICGALFIVFLVVYSGYLRWAWSGRGSNRCASNGVLAATSFYLLLSLPALWLRTTIVWRTHTSVGIASRRCNSTAIAKLCKAECQQVTVKQNSLTADPPSQPIAVQAVGASLAGTFVITAVVLFVLCHFNILSKPQADNSRRSELPTDPVRPRRNTDRFVLTALDPASNSNANANVNDNNDDDCCVVCLGELWDARACEVACGHRFHVRCISKWLTTSRRPVCPLCQSDVREEGQLDGHKEQDIP